LLQEKVACLCDNDGRIALDPADNFLIQVIVIGTKSMTPAQEIRNTKLTGPFTDYIYVCAIIEIGKRIF
jgi:hypothetical protein